MVTVMISGSLAQVDDAIRLLAKPVKSGLPFAVECGTNDIRINKRFATEADARRWASWNYGQNANWRVVPASAPRRRVMSRERVKARGHAQAILCSAFKVVRIDPARAEFRDRLLAAIRDVAMPKGDLLAEASRVLA